MNLKLKLGAQISHRIVRTQRRYRDFRVDLGRYRATRPLRSGRRLH